MFLYWTCIYVPENEKLTNKQTLECTLPAKRFPLKTVNEKKFFSNQLLTFVLTKTNQIAAWSCRNPKSFSLFEQPTEKVDPNFNNAFQLVDLCLANEKTFKKIKDKI